MNDRADVGGLYEAPDNHAIKLMATPDCIREQHEEYGACYYCCEACNYDTHKCGGCGEPRRHGQGPCDDCLEELRRESGR